MMMEFHCPYCNKALAATSEWGGNKAKCPGCKKVLTIPQPEEDVPKEKTEKT